MDTKAAILALMSVWGVGINTLPAHAQEIGGTLADDAEATNPLLNKVWVRTDADTARPGPMQIFLGDGHAGERQLLGNLPAVQMAAGFG